MKNKIINKNPPDFKDKYPLIYSIGLTVETDPCLHVPGKKLKKALRKAKIVRQFHKYFGINTMTILPDGDRAIYACDIERALRQVLQNIEPSVWEWD